MGSQTEGRLGKDSWRKEMTTTQFAILLGTIWVAPHANKWYSLIVGCFIILIAAIRGVLGHD